MNAYKTTRTVRFSAGAVLTLDEWQANARRHALYEMEPGVYTATGPLEFKAGETIGLMTSPAKGDSGLEPIDKNNHHDDDAAANPQSSSAMGQTKTEDSKPAKAGKTA